MASIVVKVLKVRPEAFLPRRQSPGASGADLHACIARPLTLSPGSVEVVPTGIALSLPEGFEAQIRPRSGLALHHGITILNAPGTIDSDYRGEIRILLINHGRVPYTIRHGDRIAQMIVARTWAVEWRQVEVLEETARGDGGFGHTGT